MPPAMPKSSLPRIVAYALIALGILLVLHFVFTVALTLLKWLALGAVVALVVWLVASKDDAKKHL